VDSRRRSRPAAAGTQAARRRAWAASKGSSVSAIHARSHVTSCGAPGHGAGSTSSDRTR